MEERRREESVRMGTSESSSGKRRGQLPSYEQFAAKKSEERRGHFKSKASKVPKQAMTTEATINIGLMEYEGDILKPLRGSSLPLKVKINATYSEILDAALKKREAFDHKFFVQRGYVLAYPDSRIAKQIPGTKEDLILRNYKDWLGKPYSRLSLYLSPIDKQESGDIGSPESDIVDLDWSDFDNDTEEIFSSISAPDGSFAGNTITIPSEVVNHSLKTAPDGDSAIPSEVVNHSLKTAPGGNSAIPSEVVDHSFKTTDFLPFGFSESEAIDHAVQLSLSEHGGDEEQQQQPIHPVSEELSIDQFTEKVKTRVSQQILGPNRNMVVSRASIWATAVPYFKRKKFAEGKGLIEVTFATFEEEEDAVDMGGPRREFLHLLLSAICKESKTVTATAKGHVIRFNVKALRENDYFTVGLMLSTIIVQGGEAPRIFSPSICQYMTSGLEKCTPSVEEVPNATVRASLEKLLQAENQDQFDKILEECDWRFEIEGLPPVIPLNHRNVFIGEVVQYYVILQYKAMLDQLLLGLQYYEVLDMVRACNGIGSFLFQHQDNSKLTARVLQKIFKPEFSPQGSNRRWSQEIVFTKFLDFINCADDGTLLEVIEESCSDLTEEEVKFIPTVTPHHVLMFSTGAAQVPVTGFDPAPSVNFVHDGSKLVPCASTCSNSLYLYVNETTIQNPIHRYLLMAMMNGGIFSKL